MAKRKKEKTFLNKLLWRSFGLVLMLWIISLWTGCLFYDAFDAAYNNASSKQVSNLLGLYGAKSADAILTWWGIALPLFLIAPFIWGYGFLRLREMVRPYWRMSAFIVGTIAFSIFISLISPYWGDFKSGGNVGIFLSRQAMSLLNRVYVWGYGQYLLALVFFVLALASFNYIEKNIKLVWQV